MLSILTNKKALELYKSQITEDFLEPFPKYEDYKQAIEKGIYTAYLYQEENISKAYAIIQETQDILFIPWYAVFKQYRSQGIGSKALREIKQEKNKEIILEVENEKNAHNKKELEIIEKRIRFYQKLGFQKIQQIEYQLNGEHYDLMIWGEKKSTQQAKNIIQNMYHEVLIKMDALDIKIMD